MVNKTILKARYNAIIVKETTTETHHKQTQREIFSCPDCGSVYMMSHTLDKHKYSVHDGVKVQCESNDYCSQFEET